METKNLDSSLETMFLEHLQKEQIEISVYLVNGIRLKGIIHKFNEKIILLRNGSIQMVRLDAISTIMPASPDKNMSPPL